MATKKKTKTEHRATDGTALSKQAIPVEHEHSFVRREKATRSSKSDGLDSPKAVKKIAVSKKTPPSRASLHKSKGLSTAAQQLEGHDKVGLQNNQARAVAILDTLEQVYTSEFEGLDFSNPLQLLVATILSAQSTDKLVNTVSPKLFRKYLSAQDYVDVPAEELEQDIRSTGYFRSKARHIQGCCAMLVERYGGQVPGTMEELIALPGVGRKTANCVLSQCFGQQGLTVDTHVNRISNLLGFVHTEDPVKIERALMEIVPHDRWNQFNELIITHGRKTCIARRPRCENCAIVDLCPSRRA